MKGDLTGTRNGEPWPAVGQEIDLPDEEGAQLCSQGMAIPVPTGDVETAVAPEPEKRRASRPRKED